MSFVSASEEFDFTTPVGEMVLTLRLAFARRKLRRAQMDAIRTAFRR